MRAKYYVKVKEGHQAAGYHWFSCIADRNLFMRRMAKKFPDWSSVVVEVK